MSWIVFNGSIDKVALTESSKLLLFLEPTFIRAYPWGDWPGIQGGLRIESTKLKCGLRSTATICYIHISTR
jgi:hypothetical protein